MARRIRNSRNQARTRARVRPSTSSRTRASNCTSSRTRRKEGVKQEMPLIPNPLPFVVGLTGGPTAQNVGPEAGQTQMFGAYDPGQTFIGTCPECSSDLQFTEGCVKCGSCGYSECG